MSSPRRRQLDDAHPRADDHAVGVPDPLRGLHHRRLAGLDAEHLTADQLVLHRGRQGRDRGPNVGGPGKLVENGGPSTGRMTGSRSCSASSSRRAGVARPPTAIHGRVRPGHHQALTPSSCTPSASATSPRSRRSAARAPDRRAGVRAGRCEYAQRTVPSRAAQLRTAGSPRPARRARRPWTDRRFPRRPPRPRPYAWPCGPSQAATALQQAPPAR